MLVGSQNFCLLGSTYCENGTSPNEGVVLFLLAMVNVVEELECVSGHSPRVYGIFNIR